MLSTYQGSYEILADATTDQTALDGSTAGSTLHWTDLPATTIAGGCKSVGTECNGIEMIAESYQDATDDTNANFKLYGAPEQGPILYMADVSCTVGTARINDLTTALYIDTMVVAEQTHIKNLIVKDSGNNRIAKLQFDFGGYKYLIAKWYDVSGCYRLKFRVY